MKDTFGIIMHFVPQNINIKDIEMEILKDKEIKNIHHVHVWQLTDEQIHLEAHLDFNRDLKLSEISLLLMRIRSVLSSKFKIEHTTLQPEININDEKKLIVLKKCY